MSTTQAPSGVKIKVYPYEDFQGIDASRDVGALDTGQKQHMVEIRNGFADWRGSLVRDPGAEPRTEGNKYIKHLNFFGRDLAVWAQIDGGGTTLKSERDHILPEVYPKSAVVTSTVYNNKVIFASRDYPMYQYDGFSWEEIKADPGEGGFMFGAQDLVSRISSHLNDRVGHSGASFAYTLRAMQAIARQGWNVFVETHK